MYRCPECGSDDVSYTFTAENGEVVEVFECLECGFSSETKAHLVYLPLRPKHDC